jgi:PAS domain S-box-containing protein
MDSERGTIEMGVSARAYPKVADSEVSTEALLRAVIDASDDAIFTLDSRGNIVTWGLTSERLFGFRTVDVLERPLYSLFPEHLHGDVRSVVSRVLAGEPIKHFESEVVRTDGMPMPVWVSLCPISDLDGAGKLGRGRGAPRRG